jgi:hypothetical protein
MIKPKPVMDRKMGDRTDKNAAGAAPKPSTSKNHADPPPSIVTEPEDGAERYAIGGFLGKGGFAVCYEGTLARNNRVFAMKVVKSQMPQKKMEEKVSSVAKKLSEGSALMSVVVPNGAPDSFQDATPLYCPILPRIRVRPKHIRCPRVMPKRLSDGYGSKAKMPHIARGA